MKYKRKASNDSLPLLLMPPAGSYIEPFSSEPLTALFTYATGQFSYLQYFFTISFLAVSQASCNEISTEQNNASQLLTLLSANLTVQQDKLLPIFTPKHLSAGCHQEAFTLSPI